jgi:MSHA pilin protein MshD
MFPNARPAGFSLIEVVIFIVVVGIGFSAMFVLYNTATRGSVDPIVRKQVLAIATSILEEIELRGFTYCDPDDPAVYTATSTADCTTPEAIGLEGTESLATRSTLDNVNDYNGLTMSASGIADIRGIAISATGLTDYSVSVSIANITAGDLPQVTDVNDALRITVTAAGPTGVSITLQGYRLRYAPNSP